MPDVPDLAAPWLFVWCCGLSVVSALVPWLSGEVVVLSIAPLADGAASLALLALSASVGQMGGKCGLYWAARGAACRPSPMQWARIESLRGRLAGHPSRTLALMFASSALSIPPSYLVTIAAGGLSIGFRRFIAASFAGLVFRFAAVVFAQRLIVDSLR